MSESRLDGSEKRNSKAPIDDECLFRSAVGRTTRIEDLRVRSWIAESAQNRRCRDEVIEVLLLSAEAEDALDFGRPPTAREILVGNTSVNVLRPRREDGWRIVLAAAAVLAMLAFVGHRYWPTDWPANVASSHDFGTDEFATEREPATVGLRDGSVVRLAPESRLRVHAREGAREVSLNGRGYFAVAPNDSTPFRIHSDAGTVTVLGTRFDLSVEGDDLRLIVVEGQVRLASRAGEVDVRAGQLARVIKGNLIPPIDVPDPASLVNWVGDFVAFQNTPLRIAAREIEAHHGVRLEFSDPSLEDRTVTALFAGRSFEEVAEVICAIAQLRCTTVDDVLRMAPATE